MKALKFTVSGSYKSHEYKIVDFEGLVGTVPYVDEDVAALHILHRYLPMWISRDDKYKDRYVRRRQLFIDNVEEVEHEFSYVGKDIREMNAEEIQDLATAKDLRTVPLWKTGSLISARAVAYAEYSTKVLGEKLDHREEGFNIKHLPAIIADGDSRRDFEKKITNEEAAIREFSGSHLTLNDLKEIAKTKSIRFHPSIGYDALYSKVFAA